MRRQLAQSRPSGTSAVKLWSLSDDYSYDNPYKIHLINIVNVSSFSVEVSIFHDVDGSTYDQSTALIYQQPLSAGDKLVYDKVLEDYQKSGNIGCQVSVANAATFSVYGEILGERI